MPDCLDTVAVAARCRRLARMRREAELVSHLGPDCRYAAACAACTGRLPHWQADYAAPTRAALQRAGVVDRRGRYARREADR